MYAVAAAFFCTYELTKRYLGPHLPDAFAPVVHMTAATAGEVVSECIQLDSFFLEIGIQYFLGSSLGTGQSEQQKHCATPNIKLY
jgi:hypothetical protein